MEQAIRGARTQSGLTAAPVQRSELRQRKTRNTASTALRFRPQVRPPGTEFLDPETGRQKQSAKCANARRDQNPGSERSEIPAETPYLASYRKRAVCGDWMVVCAVICEPVSTRNSLLTGKNTGNFAI